MNEAQKLAREAQSYFEAADAEGRSITASESRRVETCLNGVKRLQAADLVDQLGRQLGAGMTSAGAAGGGSPGDAFVASEGYKSISNSSSRGQSWSSGLVDVGYSMKGTLLEGPGAPGTGTGGGLLGAPQVIPGIVNRLFQPLSFEALLSSGQATTNTIRYAVEGTATSGAAGVAEAGNKPESTLAFSTLDEPIKKVATSIQISDELIEDAPAISSFINGTLSMFVNIEVERQLFRGTSGGNEVQGVFTSRGVPVYAGGTAAGNYAEQLFKAMNGVRGSAFVEPEWCILHPTDYQVLRLLKDTANQYYGGGPFLGAYGNGANIAPSGQITGSSDTVWGKQVYVTSAIGGAGRALIGSTAAAQVWSRGGLAVESTNSHGGNFVLDITAVRAERRLGLTVLRPGALCEVRLS